MSSSPLTWAEILKAITAKTQDEINTKVVPAVETTRFTLGTVLIVLGQKLQHKPKQ